MADTLSGGSGFVRGDAFPIYRIYTRVPAGQTITNAWLTVKNEPTDADNAALFQKAVSTIPTSDGHVEDNGSQGVARIRFDLTVEDNREPTAGVAYYYDIQIRTSNGEIHTPENGFEVWREEVTLSTT